MFLMKKFLTLAITIFFPFFSAHSQTKPVSTKKQITYSRIEIKDDRGIPKDRITLKRADGNETTVILKHNAKIGFIADGTLLEEKAFIKYLETKNRALNPKGVEQKNSVSINTADYDHIIKL